MDIYGLPAAFVGTLLVYYASLSPASIFRLHHLFIRTKAIIAMQKPGTSC